VTRPGENRVGRAASGARAMMTAFFGGARAASGALFGGVSPAAFGALAVMIVASAPACRSSTAAPEPLPPAAASAGEIERLREIDPAAGALAERAEAALSAGKVGSAAELYREVARAAPRTGLGHRRECELLTWLGRREPALAACNLATLWGGSVPDLRAKVGALVSADRPPTLDEVAEAQLLATGARRLLPGEPHGYAALADIARRIGDREMLRTNVAELERIAPHHPETARARALTSTSSRWLRPAAWIALLLLAAATSARTLQRRLRPSAKAEV
jgi:hypothetical protein